MASERVNSIATPATGEDEDHPREDRDPAGPARENMLLTHRRFEIADLHDVARRAVGEAAREDVAAQGDEHDADDPHGTNMIQSPAGS